MARRSNNHARRGNGSALPPWVWLSTGVLLGLLLAALVIWAGLAPGVRDARGPSTPTQAEAATGTDAASNEPAPTRPRYDFYTVLPETEVLIPDSELRAQVRAETPPPATPATQQPPATTPAGAPGSTFYLLQAGSFRDPRPAEERKAQLALLGMNVRVETTNVDGTAYHRVYVGPFPTAAQVEQAKQQLAGNGVDTIVMRRQNPG